MADLSKTKLLAYRQCKKRLWLEVHRPELREDSAQTQASFSAGRRVGEVARKLYDPKGRGTVIDALQEGFGPALARSAKLLETSRPIFEAGFAAGGAFAFADVMLPRTRKGQRVWHMVEVKSSAAVWDSHRDDAAIQAFVAREAGVRLASIALAHVDTTWAYPGGEDYQGLLVEKDLTQEAFDRGEEVRGWIDRARAVASKRREPEVTTGRHCSDPCACGFIDYCRSKEVQPTFPALWLPWKRSGALKELLAEGHVTDMREVPDELLNASQLRVKKHTLSGKTYFDSKGAMTTLAAHKLPGYFLDFETVRFAVPIWKGTRPYQDIPFHFSLHRLSRTGKLTQETFLDLTGADPSRAFAQALIAACGDTGPVFVFNARSEQRRLQELADRFPRLKRPLLALGGRIVDLLAVAFDHYYHPSQEGKWSLKRLLPAIAGLSPGDLEGIQDGSMPEDSYLEAIAPGTSKARKEKIESELRDYCSFDTFAMVQLWRFLAGRSEIAL